MCPCGETAVYRSHGEAFCAYHFEADARPGKAYRVRSVTQGEGYLSEWTSAKIRWMTALDLCEAERDLGNDAWIMDAEAGSEGIREVLL